MKGNVVNLICLPVMDMGWVCPRIGSGCVEAFYFLINWIGLDQIVPYLYINKIIITELGFLDISEKSCILVTPNRFQKSSAF